ncbi:hypothetical protein QCA50_005979 [Cerrena zonata]|uniref:DUF6535 domain-containing protein n=1 Tax=Cerrena zonata TaxID=2478898 RepID=A0AAW0GEH5_9APHY
MTTVFLRSGIGHSPGDRERQMLDQYRMDLERPWWFQTARDVRESDETKIRDYKEDIDTLLVFGALFSAVITALTIESYKSLTPDPAELTLQAMVHISQQLSSYTTTGQVSNSTIPAFVLPNATDFAPSSPIIITNVAWFGSLTISLMAASYGMLVKQWLREYLAYRDASPIARLRVRLFRYPALAEWKVFEIVAMLPLLLQIALGLFFLGLCFFASSIHPAVKWTIIPLVVIWASLFLIATFAPIFSSRCPYKTTFLKDIMKRLRRVIFIVLHKVKNPSANAPPGPEEEDDLGKRSDSDLDVVARTDSLHQDDGLIAPALVDLGRQLPGPDVVTFLFAVLRNRDPRIERKQVDCLVDLHQISIPLLGAATTALIASLRLEYTRQAATREQSSQSADQSDFEWAQDAFSILLSALRNPLLARPSQAITDYLSIVPPHFIDMLIDPVMDNTCYSEEQRMAFFKLLIHYIDLSSGDAKDPRPLNLHNLSERGWNHVAKVFESLIFPRVLATSDSLIAREWNHDIKLGFRGLFGVCDHDVPADVSTRIHESFTDEELIEQLLSPITASYISGHTTEVTFYLFRLFPNELSGLSEDSWRDVQNMLIVVLEKELEHQELDHQKEIDADSRTTPVVWEKSILSAIHVLLSMSQFPRSDKAMEMVIRCFDFDCEGLLDALPGGIAETFTHLIPLLWHVLTGQPTVDIEESWAEDSIDGQSQLDAAMWNVAISLHRVLKSGGSKDNEQRLALRIMFMCAKASEPQTFSNATRTRIDELMQSHTRKIVDMLPTERGRLTDYALSAFWEIMRLLDHSQTLSIIKHLYPTTYAHEVAEKLLEVWSSIQSSKSQNITNIPLGGTEILILNPFIVSHIDDSLVFGGDARSHYMDKLQPLVQLVPNEHASHTIKRLAWRMITFEHPDWPE